MDATQDEIIVLCLRWYLRYPLSYRNLEEMMAERGLSLDHSTIARWVLHYAPILSERIRRSMRQPNRSWRVDETYVRVAGRWTYLYQAINVDGHPAYPTVIDGLRQTGHLGRNCRWRRSRYMNNLIEQDHRCVKKRVVASQWFRSVDGASNTIAGYEAMNIIRKGQIRWLPKSDVVDQVRFIENTLGIAA